MGNGIPLQYFCPENPMDGGAWWAAVRRIGKSRTRLSDFTFTFHFHPLEKEMATHSSVLAWRIPGMGEPGGLPSLVDLTPGCTSLLASGKAAQSVWSIGAACLVGIRLLLLLLLSHSQSCPTLCDPIDSSPPGSTIPGILQARTLEWVAISFSNA